LPQRARKRLIKLGFHSIRMILWALEITEHDEPAERVA
jgi:hypothetical protein